MKRLSYRHESASAELAPRDYMIYEIVRLYSEVPGMGHATGLMNKIVRDAEAHGWTLVLKARPYGDPYGRLDARQLEWFYEKFGFRRQHKSTDHPIKMIRFSQKKHGS
jgi:GNAT superfamily N-acetyltransferase